MNHPSFLAKSPSPRLIQRLYHGRKIQVWEGRLKLDAIQGWVDNPRIDIAKKQLQDEVGNRPLTQDEVFNLMKNDSDFKLKDLRDNIIKNGLREPIVVTFKGKLLDGNRRFFALKYALEGLSKADPNRMDYEKIQCYVLTEEASEDDEQHVLVEENFAASLKIEWPDYVKALNVKAAAEKGIDPNDIAAKYDWTKAKVRETIRIWEIIDDFMSFATTQPDLEEEEGGGLGLSEHEAERLAASNYQFFNEAQKSFFNELKTNFEFKIIFFRWIHDGKFSSFPEVRIAYRAWNHPEAKPIIMGPEPSAAKDAKAVIDYNARIVKGREEVNTRIGSFVDFLSNLKVDQIKTLSDESCKNLRQALELLNRIVKVVAESNAN